MRSFIARTYGGFLPNYFKIIGTLLSGLTLLFITAIKIMGVDISNWDRILFKTITLDCIILGLLILVLTKEKKEDERMTIIRFKSLAYTFILAVLFVLLKPLQDMFFYKKIIDVPGQVLMLIMLVVYLTIYLFQKRIR